MEREAERRGETQKDVQRRRKTRTREIKQDTKQETLRVCDKTARQPLEPRPRLHAHLAHPPRYLLPWHPQARNCTLW